MKLRILSAACRTTGAFFPFALFSALFFVSGIEASELARSEEKNISYYSEKVSAQADEYQNNQCRLDISMPKEGRNLPVFVWFHGGGLSGGAKHYPGMMKNSPILLVAVGYRLEPKANFPAFLEDAAAAVAWTFANIERYGGDPKKIFVGGHSAGGYLAAMVGMDPRWIKPYGIERSRIAGLIVISGQVTTHFKVRKMLEYKEPPSRPVIDENAPLYHVAADLPPILLILGDRKIEWPARVEENEFLAATLRHLKHPLVEFHEHPGYDHSRVGKAPEAAVRIDRFIEKALLRQGD